MTDQDKKQLATSFIQALRSGDANGFRAIMTDDSFGPYQEQAWYPGSLKESREF